MLAVGLYAMGSWLLVGGAGPMLLGLPLLPAAAWLGAAAFTWQTVHRSES